MQLPLDLKLQILLYFDYIIINKLCYNFCNNQQFWHALLAK